MRWLSLILATALATVGCVPRSISRSSERTPPVVVDSKPPAPPARCLEACPPLPLDESQTEAEAEFNVHAIVTEYERCQKRSCACIAHWAPESPAAAFCASLPTDADPEALP